MSLDSTTLEHIGIDAERWCDAVRTANRMIGTAIGSIGSLVKEAARRKRKWVVGVFDVHCD